MSPAKLKQTASGELVVYTTSPGGVREGTISPQVNETWQMQCAVCDITDLAVSRDSAVRALDTHFISTHTKSLILS